MKTVGHHTLTWSLLLSMFGSMATGMEPLISRQTTVWRCLDRPRLFAGAWKKGLWRRREFDDSSWYQGTGVFGYGDADVTTVLAYGDNPQQQPVSALFRTRFRLPNPSNAVVLGGRLCCDDGAVVYVNGTEVFRFNLPRGEVRHDTFALRSVGPDLKSERNWRPFVVPLSLVNDGENLMGVSAHQATSTSGDLAMSLELYALDDKEAADFQEEVKTYAADSGTGSSARIQISPVSRLKFATD